MMINSPGGAAVQDTVATHQDMPRVLQVPVQQMPFATVNLCLLPPEMGARTMILMNGKYSTSDLCNHQES